MRVLHVVTHHSPDHVFGGPTRVALNLCRALRTAGDEAAVLTVGEGFEGDLPREVDGVPVKLFPARRLIPGFGFAGITSPSLLARAGGLVRSADVVHVHLARDLVTFPVALLALLGGRPLVLQTHGMIDPTRVPAARLADALGVRRVLRGADMLLHLTDADRLGVASVTAPRLPARSRRLVNGVARQEHRRPPRSERGGPPVVLFLARLEDRKRPADLIAAVPAVRAVHPDARFVLAGAETGGLAARLTAHAERLGVADAVDIVGPRDHAGVMSLMRSADVYVLPSTFDPFPVSALEALSVGLPAVVTATNGLAPDVLRAGAGRVVAGIDGDAGFAGHPGAPLPAARGARPGDGATDGNGALIAAAVLELLEPSANEAASVAAHGLVAERFTIDAVADRLRELYAEVLALHA
ncbi:glycosyltransferase [Streptomyces spiramenti]|uniref:D-inositol 3-phosphate glycosyltransferase n=1 Tax=Streptomyces spiramenti TaxID=2720606 RepID=A0ABX1AX87_9ACTN|nr:glycosyltransferase [Streptomyces spiramenti]NJP69002.1 glycosyltransferase [Streptomyces spiramenti]